MKISLKRTIQTAPYESIVFEVEVDQADIPDIPDDPNFKGRALYFEAMQHTLCFEVTQGHLLAASAIKERDKLKIQLFPESQEPQ